MPGILTTQGVANAKNHPFIKTDLSGTKVTILFDSGASISAINQYLLEYSANINFTLFNLIEKFP